MTQEHTPGPWSVVKKESGPFRCVMGPDGRDIIAYDGFDKADRNYAVDAANARLIASAPELLEALHLALDLLECAEIQSMAKKARLKGFTPDVRKIRNVVAKATGK